jgi:hypothetical protein
MFNACQYATNDTNIGYGKEVSAVKVQNALYKIITWIKKLRKWRHEWELACEVNLKAWKHKSLVKICFASKVVLFQETLKYYATINICYHQQTSRLQTWVPSKSLWAIAKAT